VKSFNIFTSSAFALITVWHLRVCAEFAPVTVITVKRRVPTTNDMIFFILYISLLLLCFFIKKEASQINKSKTSPNVNKLGLISVGNTRILLFNDYKVY
jgi:hypothetical protein